MSEEKEVKPKQRKRKSNSKNTKRNFVNNEKFDFNDILIEPAVETDIISRKTINNRYGAPSGSFGHLPIIAAPMDTVVSNKNLQDFMHAGVSVCLPRGEFYQKSNLLQGSKMIFNSYSLIDFTEKFITHNPADYPSHILIDIANGHMKDLVYITKKAKEKYGKTMILMVGNVAHPDTYKSLSLAGADYIRIGIGNGNGCLTTEQTGIGFPMGSLVRECYIIKESLPAEKRANIVADGGMKKYADVIKALSLGADYVMLGSILNKSLESAGDNYWKKIKITPGMAKFLYGKGFVITKKFRGMSTKEVQKKWGNSTLKTSEGVVRYRPVEYKLSTWVNNFSDYLKSAMSYTNCNEIEQFIGKVKYNKISYQAYMRYNK
jgi:IMP dehydrogenase/GMP reductase